MEARRRGNSGIEENTMAILDASGFTKDSQYVNDDNIAFLDAVRSASIVPENGVSPTNKMFEAIFEILKSENSLDLIMESYHLLKELDKRFPRVYVSKTEKFDSALHCTVPLELVRVKEAWSPFTFGLDIAYCERAEADKKLDPVGFHLLIQDIAKLAQETLSEAMKTKLLRNLLLLQYIVNVLEGDFLPRICVYKETMNWVLLKESLLNMLLGSRRISYKGLHKDCIFVMCELFGVHSGLSHKMRYQDSSSADLLQNCDTALKFVLPEVERCTCDALKKLLLMIMELDLLKKKADMQGLTTRVDGVRTPLVEIILDELTYNEEIISSFFQVFNEPKWKLEIIVLHFLKYIAKPSVRTRRSNGSTDDMTFNGVLRSFSNGNSTKNVTKKIGTEITQLLLAHGFQAYLSIVLQDSVEGISDIKEDIVVTCKNLISAFTSLRRMDRDVEILPFGKEALFTASTVLSTKC